MEYWITIKGEKHGPIQEWDIKKKIEAKTLSEKDLIWHSGLDSWQKLGQHSKFKADFIPTEVIEEIMAEPTPETPKIILEVIEVNHHWWQRLLAKIFDLTLYSLVFFVITNASGIRFAIDLDLAWMRFFYLIPFMMIEAFFIQNYYTTPGKALFGLKIKPIDPDFPISLSRGFFRSLGSWFIGMTLGIFPFFILSGGVTYFSTKKRGLTSWDAFAKTKVEGPKKISFGKILLFSGAFMLLMASFSTYLGVDTETLNAVEEFNNKTYQQLIEASPKFESLLKKAYTNE